MQIDEAVMKFRRAAITKGDFAQPAKKDHALHADMSAAWQALETQGEKGRAAFKALLADESRHVRCWVAAQLLAQGDKSGVPILEADAAMGDIQGFSSEMVLQEWKAARLLSPFSKVDA